MMKAQLLKAFPFALLCVFSMIQAAEEKPAPELKATAPRIKDRVYVKNVEGIWVSAAYLDALKATRSPHAAAKRSRPLVITIKRDGMSYPYLITDFRSVALRALLDLEPFSPPGTMRLVTGPDNMPTNLADVIYVPFRGTRDASGNYQSLSVADPFLGKKKWADYQRLDGELNALINRHSIAGSYQDEQGGAWELGETGEASTPQETFHFELSLEGSDANCEFMEIEDTNAKDGKRRIGFAWRGGKLALLHTKLAKKPLVRCDAKPFALLSAR
jgi:hypothetical protein